MLAWETEIHSVFKSVVSVSASSSSNYLNVIFVCVFSDLVEMNGLNGFIRNTKSDDNSSQLSCACYM